MGWQDLPDVAPAGSWKDLPDLSQADRDMRARELSASAVGKAEGEGEAAMDKALEPSDVVVSTRGARAGLAQGLSRGFSDELEGAVNAGLAAGGVKINDRNDLSKGLSLTHPAAPPSWEDLKKAYEDSRNARRSDIAEAKAAQPIQYTTGDVAGSMVGPGAGGTTKLGRAALGFVSGAARGYGSSDAEDGKQGAFDAATGGATGALANVVGGAVGDRFAGKAQAVEAATRDAQQKAAEKALRSATSGLGGETSSAVRTFEVLKEAANDMSLPAAERAAAAARLQEPDMIALAPQVVRSSIARSYGQSNRMADARDAMTEAARQTEPASVDAATQARLSDWAPLRRRVRTLAERYGPGLALGALGYAHGGQNEGIAGLATGLGVSHLGGKPLLILQNLLADPTVASRVARTGEALSGPATQGAVQQSAAHAPEFTKYLEENAPKAWSSLTGDDEEKK